MSILLDINKLNEKSQEFYDEIFNFRKDNMDLMSYDDKEKFYNFERELVNFINFINLKQKEINSEV